MLCIYAGWWLRWYILVLWIMMDKVWRKKRTFSLSLLRSHNVTTRKQEPLSMLCIINTIYIYQNCWNRWIYTMKTGAHWMRDRVNRFQCIVFVCGIFFHVFFLLFLSLLCFDRCMRRKSPDKQKHGGFENMHFFSLWIYTGIIVWI